MTSPFIQDSTHRQNLWWDAQRRTDEPGGADLQLAARLVHVQHRRGGGGDRGLLGRPADGHVGIKERSNAERLAAVVSGMTSLAGGAASWYALGGLNRVIVDMADGYLLITAISSGSVLGVVADRSANLGTWPTR